MHWNVGIVSEITEGTLEHEQPVARTQPAAAARL